MPYIPPHLRPGYTSKSLVSTTRRRGVHFPTNALHANDRTTNVTIPSRKYSPTRKNVKKPAIKRTMRVSPKRTPPAEPTSNVEKLPKKFRNMLMARGINHLASSPR